MTSVMTLPSHMTGFLYELGNHTGVYSYVSYPSAILPNRPRYRSEANNNTKMSVNIMHDKRVYRGNTYAHAHKVPVRTMNVTMTEDAMRKREQERRAYVRRRVLPQIKQGRLPSSAGSTRSSHSEATPHHQPSNGISGRVGVSRRKRANLSIDGPPAVSGREHGEFQTERWLEEIKDRTVEVDVAVQTDDLPDLLMTKSVPPRDVPEVIGVDKSTQILPDDPDLFVFDEEVIGVLEALVSKTLEQSLLEVIEEEELAAIAKQKQEFKDKAMALQSSN